MRNFEALRKLRDTLTFTPEKHDQGNWGSVGDAPITVNGTTWWSPEPFEKERRFVKVSCPTSACAAGHAVLSAGDVMLFNPEGVFDGEASSVWCQDKKGKVRAISDRARSILGLTPAQAGVLFDGDSSTEEVIEMLDVLLKDDMPTAEVTKTLKKMYREFEDKRYD